MRLIISLIVLTDALVGGLVVQLSHLVVSWGNLTVISLGVLGSLVEENGGKEEDDGEHDEDDERHDGSTSLGSWLVDNHWVVILEFVDHSEVSGLLQVVVSPCELGFPEVHVFFLDWENVVDNVPLNSLSAWWGGERSSVGESWVVLDGVQELSIWHRGWSWVFLVKLE